MVLVSDGEFVKRVCKGESALMGRRWWIFLVAESTATKTKYFSKMSEHPIDMGE
jgi:hypothetical protein